MNKVKRNNCASCVQVDNIFELGCYSHCGNIELPILVNNSGIHTFQFETNGIRHVWQEYQRKGEKFNIKNKFNEQSYKVQLTIIEPKGNVYIYKHFDKLLSSCKYYHKFLINTKIAQFHKPEPCNDLCCEPDIIECNNDPVYC
jgi:hypothetical protein